LLDTGFARIDGSLARLVKGGKLGEDDAKGRAQPPARTTSLAEFADRDLVIEAVVEVIDAKKAVWDELDKVCGAETIFASKRRA